MDEERQINPQDHRMDEFEDEIELMDYLKVIWKWKYLILVGTLVCAIGAAVVSLNMTKVYGISTVLQPGVLKVSEDGKVTYIDSPNNIKALIEIGAFNGKILKNIILPNKEDVVKFVEFKVTIPKGTNALDVLYETPDVDLGLQIIGNLNNALLERYGTLIKAYEENYDTKIRSKSSEAFKLNEKAAKVKHAIGTAEAENESAISQISARIASKRAEITTVEAENMAKLSELATKVSAKRAEISTSENENEAKISQLTAKISSRTAEISTAKAETETRLSQIKNKISSTGTKIASAEAQKEKTLKLQVSRGATIRAQIDAKKKQIHNLELRISDVKTEIGRMSKNTDLLIEERDKLLSSAKQDDSILASVMYSNTIQQNIGYLNTLRSTINNTNHQKFQESAGIEKLENDIKDLQAQKVNLERQTKLTVESLKSDMEDLENQTQGVAKQMEYAIKDFEVAIEDLEAQKVSSVKQMKSKLENLQAEIRDLGAQNENAVKQAKSKTENLNADIKDLETQKQSLVKQTKYKTETLKSEIKDLVSEKKYVLDEIKSIEFKENNIQNIQIIKVPKSSLSPIKPKTRLNVMLAGVVGLFLTVFLGFLLEYISKYKSREDER